MLGTLIEAHNNALWKIERLELDRWFEVHHNYLRLDTLDKPHKSFFRTALGYCKARERIEADKKRNEDRERIDWLRKARLGGGLHLTHAHHFVRPVTKRAAYEWDDVSENGGTAEKAVGVIEKHGDFNGGYGSRLNVNGEEERDAVIMDGHNMKSGFTASFGVIGGTIFTNKMTLSREVTPHITERGQSAQIQKLNKEIRGKDQEIAELKRQNEKLKKENRWKDQEIAELKRKVERLRQEIGRRDQEIGRRDQEIVRLREQNEALQQENREKNQEIDDKNQENREKNQEIDELKQQLNSMRNVVREKHEKIAEKDETIQEFQAEKQALIQKIVDLEQKDSDELLRNNQVPADITNMSLDIRFDHESVECERCPEYCTKIVRLQEKLMKGEEKRQELEQENGTLKRQLDGSRETANLWKYVLVEEARDLRRKDKRDLEDKYKQEIAVLSDKIHSLENDNNSLNKKVCEQKREHEIVEQNILREGNAEKKALQSKISALETENSSLAEKITESKNFIDNMLREEQKEKTAMVEIIQKLQDENRGKNEEIVELKEQAAQHKTTLDAVKAQLETVTDERETARTQFNHLQTYNGALQSLISQFRRRLQDLEDREDRLCAMVI